MSLGNLCGLCLRMGTNVFVRKEGICMSKKEEDRMYITDDNTIIDLDNEY